MSLEQKKKTYRIEALGCRTNQYEAQSFRDQLAQMGYVPATDGEHADLCIVNTCTVTKNADSDSRHLIRQMIRKSPGTKMVVTGCSAERDPHSMLAIEGVHRVVKNADKEKLVQLLFPDVEVPEFSIKNFDAHTRAFVKVQDGCNSFCTYCIIPYVRGRSTSRTIDSVLQEVEGLIASGFQEIVLTGINVGDFDGGVKDKYRLVDLIKAVDAVKGVKRLRVSSIDPDEIDKDLQDAILFGKNTCHSMHIVLQSGSNAVLKRMNRKYTRQIFLETVRRLRAESPDFTVTTDIIVGFPGETDLDFQETLEVVRETQFTKTHMFPYSDRPRTRSNLFTDKIAPAVIGKRKAELLQVANESAFLQRERYVGRTMSILTEEAHEDSGLLFGHTDNFLGVYIQKGNFTKNQIVNVKLIENRPDALFGVVV